ncbi:MAG: glycoside hydrolase family 5 protein, partial [Candidatus Dormibacteraceae bacterium]
DQIIAAAGLDGLRIILVNQTNEAGDTLNGWGAQQPNGLWYDLGGASNNTDGLPNSPGNPGTVTEASFVTDWTTIAQHYAHNPTILGYDLRNEPLAYSGMCTWGDDDADHDLRLMYETVGNAVLAIDTTKLIVCEGPQDYSGSFSKASVIVTGSNGKKTKTPLLCPWGDLSTADTYPVKLAVPHKVVYSIHDYPNEISGFSTDSGPSKVALMNAGWGYLVTKNLAPVWIGEMGSSMLLSEDQAWAQTLLDYMNGQSGSSGGPTFSGNQQGIGGDWWAWGYLWNENPDGMLNLDKTFKADQEAIWSQMLYTAVP